MSGEKLRLFFALNVNRAARKEITHLQSKVWGENARGLTRPENLHLTLAFLGNTDPARLEDLRVILDGLDVVPLSLRFDHIGVFRQAGGEIWWLGMEENRELQDLQSRLTRELRKGSFPVEERKFVPHLTLARKAAPHNLPKGGRLYRPVQTKVSVVSLMRSQQIDGKTQYVELLSIGRT